MFWSELDKSDGTFHYKAEHEHFEVRETEVAPRYPKMFQYLITFANKTNSVAFNPQANYTAWATAT
jgi:hypothetical protein